MSALFRFRPLPVHHYFLTVIAILTTVYCFVRPYATHTHRSLTVYLPSPLHPQRHAFNTHRFRHPFALLSSSTTLRGSANIQAQSQRPRICRSQVVSYQRYGHTLEKRADNMWRITALVNFALCLLLYRWSMISSVKNLCSSTPLMATLSGSPTRGKTVLQ